jgi:hypothetical protein
MRLQKTPGKDYCRDANYLNPFADFNFLPLQVKQRANKNIWFHDFASPAIIRRTFLEAKELTRNILEPAQNK